MAADPDSTRWTTLPQPYGRGDAEGRIISVAGSWRDRTAHRWAIETGGRFAGSLDIRHGDIGDGGVPEIGYVLAPWARGHRTMSRAVRPATRWAFDEGQPLVHWWARARVTSPPGGSPTRAASPSTASGRCRFAAATGCATAGSPPATR